MTARPPARFIMTLVSVATVLIVGTILGIVVAITGAGLGGCQESSASPSRAADEIPPARLRLYHSAARRYDIDWAFLASIGAQECHHGSCAGDNGSGCAGPMQIAVRRNSPCSRGNDPTLWETYGVDADHDGHTDPNDPADAIFTAARILRQAKHAPPAGGNVDEYRRAACNYYGACGDATADYANQVIDRAIAYGLGEPTDGGCAAAPATVPGDLGEVVRDHSPGGLAPLPQTVTGGAQIDCDRRIRDDVDWLAQRFHVLVSACYAIHSKAGEHPLGAAVDLVPVTGRTWKTTTLKLARAVGWKRSCAASGVAPTCARPPFRFVGYNGYPGHGDRAHCRCGDRAHLHLSWLTSASEGQPQNAARETYFAPAWIDTFVGEGREQDR